ncbi:MAG: M23 family metallopeptidase [Sulfurimonas sp.]|nr:M23 family metallopeptidase [Sulfurimonas sp.]
MIKIFFALVFFMLSLSANVNIDKKINKASSKIKNFSKSYSSINKKMSLNAKAILKQKEAILKQQKYLTETKVQLKQKEKTYKLDNKKLIKLKKEQKKLKKNQNKIEQDLVFTIAKSASISIILEENYSKNEDSIIEIEILQAMLKKTIKQVENLNKTFYKNSKTIESINKNTNTLEITISLIDEKRKKLISVQNKNKKALKKLQSSENKYKKSLKKLIKKQDALKQTLAKLKIIKIDKIKKAKEDKVRKKAFTTKIDDKDLPKVRKTGSSYRAVKTKKYRGEKTITPIYPYTITKEYGTYTDPIYGIKIFNESISMKPKSKNTKVKTVFNGKVIYADKTAILNNIVIIEHKNGLHTIYANLSQISPNIKKGKKIKKGYTIGRVNEELIFEVTQKSFHVNPIRLFK